MVARFDFFLLLILTLYLSFCYLGSFFFLDMFIYNDFYVKVFFLFLKRFHDVVKFTVLLDNYI